MTDVLVIGTGVAGLSAALSAAEAGARVAVVTKAALTHTATDRAQGGMAAMTGSLPGGNPADSVRLHVQDTLVAGAGLCDPLVVHGVVRDSAAAVRDLTDHGVAFDRVAGPDSPWVQGLEAAHSVSRILHAGGDATGHAIQEALSARICEVAHGGNIRLREYTLVTEVIVAGDRIVGCTVRPVLHGEQLGGEEFLPADHVVMATGGAGQLYPWTTNPSVATGDGIALALRSGAEVRDLEFFQFHPTALAAPGSFLISEAARGEGAVLRDQHGHRFMTDVDPRAELAPRDVVARAIFTVRTVSDDGAVYLDCSAVPVPPGLSRAEFLARRFPSIHAELTRRGIDWSTEWVPVSPAAHYLMGGIATDALGRTTVPGLWAAGECARTGMHGANRLASNSLLEAAVLGRRIGELLAGPGVPSDVWPVARGTDPEPRVLDESATTALLRVRDGSDSMPDHSSPTTRTAPAAAGETGAEPFSRDALQHTMWQGAGVFRTAEGLERAKARLGGWLAAASSGEEDTVAAPGTLAEAEDRNLLTVGHALVCAALARTESRGAHQRADHPTTDPLLATSTAWIAPRIRSTDLRKDSPC
ncbi:L-aspartate oxidase [Kocuria marina]|uniref:L-aspartate oxidase n=1 Tax=Kocuria marina TaxID=223184 RepID=UPI0011A1FEE0|nr:MULTISPECIES: FAD-dependent oxidoreductase [Kocuria]MCT2020175.1 FAD-dependent oxidoreductase [Kocuria marina]